LGNGWSNNMTEKVKVVTQPANEHFACTTYAAPYVLSLVIKRTYEISSAGLCQLAVEQLPVCDDVVDYAEVESPQVAIPQWDNDLFSLKTLTDVVVQGSAQTYGAPRSETTVELKFANIHRKINVFGDRIVYWSNGKPLFTQPEPFEKLPIRYDRAYGGLDRVALQRYEDPVAKLFTSVRPEWQLETTSPFHYPRNPSGKGYVITGDRESLEGLSIPNLEWHNDPLDPARLVVGEVKNWMVGAIPAAFDWFDQANFPRLGYLGQIADYNLPEGGVPEVQLGYAATDLMAERSIFTRQMHPLFVQGATPGLSVKELSPDETFLLVNIAPELPQLTVKLSGEVPNVKVRLPKRKTVKMRPFLSSVVLQPEDNRVVTVWSCRSEVDRPYGEPEYPYLPYEVVWKRR
jgi:hypothetical protein